MTARVASRRDAITTVTVTPCRRVTVTVTVGARRYAITV
jgi:hypothetical protein